MKEQQVGVLRNYQREIETLKSQAEKKLQKNKKNRTISYDNPYIEAERRLSPKLKKSRKLPVLF